MTKTATAPESMVNDYADIKRRLSEPVPPGLISTRPQGGATIEYINITNYKDLLDARVGIWESIVTDFKQIGESLCCVVKLIIHADDGIYAQDGTGIEPINVVGYGDAFSNSYAQAFRRACEGHGLSRELWRREGHDTPQGNGSSTARPAGYNNGKPTDPTAGDKATAAQLNALRAISQKAGHHVVDMIAQEWERAVEPEDLSKQAASYLISISQPK